MCLLYILAWQQASGCPIFCVQIPKINIGHLERTKNWNDESLSIRFTLVTPQISCFVLDKSVITVFS